MNDYSKLLLVTLALSVSIVGVAAADGDNTLSAAVANDIGWIDTEIHDEVITVNDTPSWVVEVQDGKMSSLEAWANESESRTVRKTAGERAVIVAPTDAVVDPGLLADNGLHTLDYVSMVDYNVEASLVEPVTPSGFEGLSTAESFLTRGQIDGQAHDVNKTTIADARAHIGADNVSDTGSSVTVAVIDTGLNFDSDLYDDRVVAARNFVDNETVNTSSSNPDWSKIADGNGHGSWVASSIAADASNDTWDGVAPDSNLAIAKALADDGSGSTGDIVSAVEWSCERADIVSMSLGSPVYSEALDNAVSECVVDHNATVVLASGNFGENPAMMYISSPADSEDLRGIIAVGATSNEPPEDARIAAFSEVGPNPGYTSLGETAGATPTVAAPGMEITVQTADGESTLSGTSMATPIVSGSLALAMDANNLHDDPEAVEKRVEQSSYRAPNLGQYEAEHGFISADGMVNAVERTETQAEARNDQAVARDLMYETYSQSRIIRMLGEIDFVGDSL